MVREVDAVVMESTAQYWRPVWEALERPWQSQRRYGRHLRDRQTAGLVSRRVSGHDERGGVNRSHRWLDGATISPNEKVKKERLKAILAG